MNNDVLIWITCRNYERCVERALESAHQQAQYVFLYHDHCGQPLIPLGTASARNLVQECFMEAHYVIFLDADDIMPPNYVSALLRVANGEECVVTCNGKPFTDGQFSVMTPQLQVRQPVNLETLLEQNTVHVSALIPFKTFRQLGGFDPELLAFEDWDLWCRFASCGVEFRHCAETALYIRKHPDSRHNNKKMTLAEASALMQRRYACALEAKR